MEMVEDLKSFSIIHSVWFGTLWILGGKGKKKKGNNKGR